MSYRLKLHLSFLIVIFSTLSSAAYPELLDYSAQQSLYTESNKKINQLIQLKKNVTGDEKMSILVNEFLDYPYLHEGAMGESDWQANKTEYVAGEVHLQQYPTYRFDAFDCETFVQNILAVWKANNLAEFQHNLIHIAYGAAKNPNDEWIRYYNRNHFVEIDFNPINHKNGFLRDVTSIYPLSDYHKTITTIISRQKWFDFKKQQMNKLIAVFNDYDTDLMEERYDSLYAHLPFPHFQSEEVTLSYLPKERLILENDQGEFESNEKLLSKIPTPAIIEFVRDPKQWYKHGELIKNATGTNLLISHIGFLFRKTYHQGEKIFDKVECNVYGRIKKNCDVVPTYCDKTHCDMLMMAHVSNAYPDNYSWYRSGKTATCSPNKPGFFQRYTTCNRVDVLPLTEYLLQVQNGNYIFMDDPSILGVHVEKIQ